MLVDYRSVIESGGETPNAYPIAFCGPPDLGMTAKARCATRVRLLPCRLEPAMV